MTKVAIVGFGFMGRMHYGNWKKVKGAKVVAICDADLSRFTKPASGNLEGADASTDFTGIGLYDDFGKMLKAGGFDVVDITLPTPIHPSMTVAALEAGKDVLCEKPMALTVKECDKMLAAAKRTGRTLLIAQCLRFFSEYLALKKLVASGRFGKTVAAEFSRVAYPPLAAGDGRSWFLDEKRSGGCLLDMHIHDADMVLSLFGKPSSAKACIHRRGDGLLDHAQIAYEYPDKVVSATVSWAATTAHGFEASFRVMMEQATVTWNSRPGGTMMVYPAKGKPFTPKLSKMNGYEGEIRYFLGLLAGRHDDSMLSASDARDAVALVRGIKYRR